jgi:hypothetical protein
MLFFCYSETMSVQTFHWVQGQLDRCHEMLIMLKKNRKNWVKRQHHALKAYQVLLLGLSTERAYRPLSLSLSLSLSFSLETVFQDTDSFEHAVVCLACNCVMLCLQGNYIANF